jgi:hypothetical protein
MEMPPSFASSSPAIREVAHSIMDTKPAPRFKGSSDKAVGIGILCGSLVFGLIVQPLIVFADPEFRPGFYLIGPGGFVGGVIGWLVWRFRD